MRRCEHTSLNVFLLLLFIFCTCFSSPSKSCRYVFNFCKSFICDKKAAVLGCTAQVNNPMLIYSTAKEIRLLNTSRPILKSKSFSIVDNYTYITSIDYHYEKKKIFWMDQHLESIFSIDYVGNTAKNRVRTSLYHFF